MNLKPQEFRRIKAVFICLFIIICCNFFALIESAPCPRGYFTNPRYTIDLSAEKCRPCSTCPPGTVIKTKCGAWADTACGPCVPGYTSSARLSSRNYCRVCKTCGTHRKVKTKCTATQDTECGECDIGYYWNNIYDKCEKCSWCYPDIQGEKQAYLASACNRPEVPEDFRCATRVFPPYQPPTWHPTPTNSAAETTIHIDKESTDVGSGSRDSDEYFSGSGDRVAVDTVEYFPTDDEELSDPTDPTGKKGKKREKTKVSNDTEKHIGKTAVVKEEKRRKKVAKKQEKDIVAHNQNFPRPASLVAVSNYQENAYRSASVEKRHSSVLGTSRKAVPSQDLRISLVLAVVGLSVFTVLLLCALAVLLKRYVTIKRQYNNAEAEIKASNSTLFYDEMFF